MASLLHLLLPAPRHTAYALLDANGTCLAFKHCSQAPEGDGWVQVHDVQLAWLGHALPADARVCKPTNRRWHQRILAA
ncbi:MULTISPECIES: hypothetical protein [Pseudomonas]|uniref:hypothetical protein n=1 Tax=Pseudomonas TaxID=286 RepID=UPI0011A2D75C|nr:MULTISPECIES: hypothetical protein [Pseudomonas]MBF8676436.1 hypothetical protein [Pseudomonas fulva]MBF8696848.1 hypothetical protein [Pseudomonas fulva]MBI6927237.1 hypothetical protein [Pseudomonas putida]